MRDDVKDTESYVRRSESNYEARQQAERDRQAKIEAEEIEKEKQAQLSRKAKELMDRLGNSNGQSYSSDSYSSSSSSPKTTVSYVCTSTCTGKWDSKRGAKVSRVYTFSVSDPNSYNVPVEIIVKSDREFEEYCENTWSFHDNKLGNGALKGYVQCGRKY